MTAPPDCTLLASESSHGDGWTCTVRVWRTPQGSLGASLIAERERDDRSALLIADGFSESQLADRLGRVWLELDVPETLTGRAVSRAWASAGANSWGLQQAESEQAHGKPGL